MENSGNFKLQNAPECSEGKARGFDHRDFNFPELLSISSDECRYITLTKGLAANFLSLLKGL